LPPFQNAEVRSRGCEVAAGLSASSLVKVGLAFRSIWAMPLRAALGGIEIRSKRTGIMVPAVPMGWEAK
jgi:hypothetical protein